MPKTVKKVVKKTVKSAKKSSAAKPAAKASAIALTPLQSALDEVAPPAAAMLQQAEKFVITDETSSRTGTEMLVQLKRIELALESRKKALTKPLKDEAKAIEAQFRPSVEALDRADGLLRAKTLMYRQKVEEAATEARLKLLAESEVAAEAGDHDEALALAQDAMSTDAAITKRTDVESGGVQVKMMWTFEVEDVNKVPREFFTLDESKIRAAVRSGQRDIEGVRVFQKEQLAVSAA